MGTPPGITGRRRSTSGSSCGGSPPPFSAGSPWPLVNSPLRRVGSHFPVGSGASGGSGPLAPIIGSPTKLHLVANFGESPSIPCGSAGAAGAGSRLSLFLIDFDFSDSIAADDPMFNCYQVAEGTERSRSGTRSHPHIPAGP